MRFLLDFFRQKVPKSGKEIPLYFRRALTVSSTMLTAYYLVCFLMYPLINNYRWEWIPILFMAGTAAGIQLIRKQGLRINLLYFTALCIGWVSWNVSAFGWGSGTQHFLTLILMLVFFNVYEIPLVKVVWFLAILAFRVLLFSWSQLHPALYVMDQNANTIYQTLNTVAFFLILACDCILFSASTQDTERQLRLRNQTLYKEAGTDALTGLPNRRAMIEKIEDFRKNNADQVFSIAIADIDFFKQVNDTYGHNCGDYTLVKLTELFAAHSNGNYTACRWGGEEFCLFIPGKNVDEAGVLMHDLCFAVEKMKLHFEDHDFGITITIGVEENDFSSPLEELLDAADKKLYMGKNNGRNQVVV